MKNVIWFFCRVLKLWLNKQQFTNLPFFSVKFSDIKHIHNAMQQSSPSILRAFSSFRTEGFLMIKYFLYYYTSLYQNEI